VAVPQGWLSTILAAVLLLAGAAAFSSAANGGGTGWARAGAGISVPSQPSFGDFIRELPIIGR
jgi:hypothetical protein